MTRLEYTYRRMRREHPYLVDLGGIVLTIAIGFLVLLLLADGFIMVN